MADSTVTIAVLAPDLLGTYGDIGNALVLDRRLAWRGLSAEVLNVNPGTGVPETADIYLLGGGEDAQQTLATTELVRTTALGRAVDRGAVVFAVCAGFQILGHRYPAAGTERAGPASSTSTPAHRYALPWGAHRYRSRTSSNHDRGPHRRREHDGRRARSGRPTPPRGGGWVASTNRGGGEGGNREIPQGPRSRGIRAGRPSVAWWWASHPARDRRGRSTSVESDLGQTGDRKEGDHSRGSGELQTR